MIARWFWREWRSPSLLIVWLALSLAVACVLALGNISDRMEKGLSQQSREFMAGDRALRSSREVPQAWLEEAQKRGLKVGKQLTFATMTFAGDTPQLANVKAVDDIYPMYGDLQTNPPGLGVGSPGAINSAATRTNSTAMRNGCYLSLNPNNAGTVWNRTKARWGDRWNARSSSCCFRRF